MELLAAETPEHKTEEYGDLMFVMVNMGRKLGIDPEGALRQASRKFASRFARVERFAADRGLELRALGLDALDELWQDAKIEEAEERASGASHAGPEGRMSIGGGLRFGPMAAHRGRCAPCRSSWTYRSGPTASCIIRVGGTHVLCAATIEDRIPPHLRGKGIGWVTAEYAMLPGATSERSQRESVKGKLGGRTHEIQRLIGRSLRGVVDTTVLGERTVTIDCDVLQADGGTRCASITGGWVALAIALRRAGYERALKGHLGAVSVGIVEDTLLLDLDYPEDSRAEVDFNVVATDAGTYVEVQGTAEGKPFQRTQMDRLLELADGGIAQLFAIQAEAVERGGPAAPPAPAASGRRRDRPCGTFPRAPTGGSSSPPAPATSSTSCVRCSTCRTWSSSRSTTWASPTRRWRTRRPSAATRSSRRASTRLWRRCPPSPDDSGVEVDALGGGPGVYTRRYAGPDATDADNNAKLLRELGDLPPSRRGARYVCVLAYLDPGATPPGERPWVVTRSGTFRGRIAFGLRGQGGFGYDPLFEPLSEPPGGRTVGQMTAEEKNRVSHRARASMAMARHLKTRGW